MYGEASTLDVVDDNIISCIMFYLSYNVEDELRFAQTCTRMLDVWSAAIKGKVKYGKHSLTRKEYVLYKRLMNLEAGKVFYVNATKSDGRISIAVMAYLSHSIQSTGKTAYFKCVHSMEEEYFAKAYHGEQYNGLSYKQRDDKLVEMGMVCMFDERLEAVRKRHDLKGKVVMDSDMSFNKRLFSVDYHNFSHIVVTRKYHYTFPTEQPGMIERAKANKNILLFLR